MVGLYVCPGEALKPIYHAAWINEVIFAAAKESNKNPLIIIRDWHLDDEKFIKECSGSYVNLYTETKHNIEMLVSPVPDPRHHYWKNVGMKHIVNLHEASDIKPFRWGSPLFIEEMVSEWKKIGISGAEIYTLTSWRFPYTLDKLEPSQNSFWPEGKKLLTFERDATWLDASGRYLWKLNRDPNEEYAFWVNEYAKKFGNTKSGELLYKWYITTGPILPGLQNLTSVANMNFFPTAVGNEQYIDNILHARNKMLEDNYRSRGKGLYASQPVDSVFFSRYKKKYQVPGLQEKISMPVLEYAKKIANNEQIFNKITPINAIELIEEMAYEGVTIAEEFVKAADLNKEEVARFLSDSRALLLLTQAWKCKIIAAYEKALWSYTDDKSHLNKMIEYLQKSVAVYEELVLLTHKTYINPTDMVMKFNWHQGLQNFKLDLEQNLNQIEKDTIIRPDENKFLNIKWGIEIKFDLINKLEK